MTSIFNNFIHGSFFTESANIENPTIFFEAAVKDLDSQLAKLLRLVGREVEAIANDAESYVEKRLFALETKFKNLIPPKRRTRRKRFKRSS